MKYIVLNWKLFPENETKAINLVSLICQNFKKLDKKTQKKYKLILCPPFIYIPPLQKYLNAQKFQNILSLGGQNVFYHNRGAYTGEISPMMLKSYNVRYCLVGHSERKLIFHETNEDIRNKTQALLNQNMKSIICVGEKKRNERENSMSFRIKNEIFTQLNEILRGIPFDKMTSLMIAYEPIWAISKNNPTVLPAPEDVKKAINNIKFWLETRFANEAAKNIPILYGGSVNPQNFQKYLEISDGVLVGSAGTKKESIAHIIKNLS